MKRKKELLFKLVIIGDAATGKSSLLRRYCENTFTEDYECSIGVGFQIKILKMRDQRIVKLQIWDTAGQERYKVMTKSYYRNARACLIVYDVTRRVTFDNVKVWAEQYSQNNPSNRQFVIILGNKKDLTDKRQVSTSEGQSLADEVGSQFREISAKEGGEEIDDIFFNLAEELLKQNDEKASTQDGEKNEDKRIVLNNKDLANRPNEKCC